MISVKTTQAWNRFSALYGGSDLKQRYDWFLFEWGKRATTLFMKHLSEDISSVQGSKQYRKSLMLAEIRDKAHRSWWAVIASAKPMSEAKYDSKTSVLKVVSRFENIDGDPVKDILENLGPWTVETIPFLPSSRAGQVVLNEESKAKTKAVLEENMRNSQKTRSAMVVHGIAFEPRDTVYKKLKVIEDIELLALRVEFGLASKSKPHWRPSLRWLRRQAISKLEKDKDLTKIWFDPKFRKHKVFRHLKTKLTPIEVKRIQNFQTKVRV